MLQNAIYTLSASLLASLGASTLCQSTMTQCDTFLNKRKAKELIKWSATGDDFIGPVAYSEGHYWLIGKEFISPSQNMKVVVKDRHLVLVGMLPNQGYEKVLHPDGNTHKYSSFENLREITGMNSVPNLMVEHKEGWDINGSPI